MAAQFTNGEVLPNGATVETDTFVTLPTGTTVESLREVYPNGSVNHTVITTPGTTTPAAVASTLQAKAVAAITNNIAWVTTASAFSYNLNRTEQQNLVNHVIALTRQVNALIKLQLGELTNRTGT